MGAEVIVVGAGHNGLICAAYLARAGIDTILLEARSTVGGCASTVADLGARFNICNCDHTMIRALPISDELELGSHGLRYVESEASGVHAFYDGAPPWAFFAETDRTLDAIQAAFPAQVGAYRRYLRDAMPVAELLIEMAKRTPSAPRLLAGIAKARARGAARLLDWSRRSAEDVLSGYFDDWHLTMPAISTGPTVWGVPPGARGTGLAAAAYATRHLVKTGRPAGGSGALTDAARASFEAAGGVVHCDVRVDGLLVADGRVRGVRLDDGTEMASPTVVAACDPRRVFVDWLDAIPRGARRTVRRWRDRPAPSGYESKIDAVLDGLPEYATAAALPAGLDVHGPTTVVSPSPAQLDASHRFRELGRVAPFPTLLVNIPSAMDPLMAPAPDAHVLSLEVLHTPYDLVGGWTNSDEPDRWLDLWATHVANDGREGVGAWRTMTPDRYESEFSMDRGHTPSFSGSPLATLVGRNRELTRYRTPVGGLYLTGAATFPGAGIFGASGRNAASVIRGDLHRKQRRLTR